MLCKNSIAPRTYVFVYITKHGAGGQFRMDVTLTNICVGKYKGVVDWTVMEPIRLANSAYI